jgi:hypothetical protein
MGVISSRPSGRKGSCFTALASRPKDIAQVRDSSEDGEETMPHEWGERDDEGGGRVELSHARLLYVGGCLRVDGRRWT